MSRRIKDSYNPVPNPFGGGTGAIGYGGDGMGDLQDETNNDDDDNYWDVDEDDYLETDNDIFSEEVNDYRQQQQQQQRQQVPNYNGRGMTAPIGPGTVSTSSTNTSTQALRVGGANKQSMVTSKAPSTTTAGTRGGSNSREKFQIESGVAHGDDDDDHEMTRMDFFDEDRHGSGSSNKKRPTGSGFCSSCWFRLAGLLIFTVIVFFAGTHYARLSGEEDNFFSNLISGNNKAGSSTSSITDEIDKEVQDLIEEEDETLVDMLLDEDTLVDNGAVGKLDIDDDENEEYKDKDDDPNQVTTTDNAVPPVDIPPCPATEEKKKKHKPKPTPKPPLTAYDPFDEEPNWYGSLFATPPYPGSSAQQDFSSLGLFHSPDVRNGTLVFITEGDLYISYLPPPSFLVDETNNNEDRQRRRATSTSTASVLAESTRNGDGRVTTQPKGTQRRTTTKKATTTIPKKTQTAATTTLSSSSKKTTKRRKLKTTTMSDDDTDTDEEEDGEYYYEYYYEDENENENDNNITVVVEDTSITSSAIDTESAGTLGKKEDESEEEEEIDIEEGDVEIVDEDEAVDASAVNEMDAKVDDDDEEEEESVAIDKEDDDEEETLSMIVDKDSSTTTTKKEEEKDQVIAADSDTDSDEEKEEVVIKDDDGNEDSGGDGDENEEEDNTITTTTTGDDNEVEEEEYDGKTSSSNDNDEDTTQEENDIDNVVEDNEDIMEALEEEEEEIWNTKEEKTDETTVEEEDSTMYTELHNQQFIQHRAYPHTIGAMKLTTTVGNVLTAKLSPKGDLVAFTATYTGTREVYVMNLHPHHLHQPALRLTYLDSPYGVSSVVGWSQDGTYIIISAQSTEASLPDTRLYKLYIKRQDAAKSSSLNGGGYGLGIGATSLLPPSSSSSVVPSIGQIEPIPLSQAIDATMSSDEDCLYFVRCKQSSNTARYVGGTVENLWAYCANQPLAIALTYSYRGTSKAPKIYTVNDDQKYLMFMSDRSSVDPLGLKAGSRGARMEGESDENDEEEDAEGKIVPTTMNLFVIPLPTQHDLYDNSRMNDLQPYMKDGKVPYYDPPWMVALTSISCSHDGLPLSDYTIDNIRGDVVLQIGADFHLLSQSTIVSTIQTAEARYRERRELATDLGPAEPMTTKEEDAINTSFYGTTSTTSTTTSSSSSRTSSSSNSEYDHDFGFSSSSSSSSTSTASAAVTTSPATIIKSLDIAVYSDFHSLHERRFGANLGSDLTSMDVFKTSYGHTKTLLGLRGQTWVCSLKEDDSNTPPVFSGSGQNIPSRRYRVIPGSTVGGIVRVLAAKIVPNYHLYDPTSGKNMTTSGVNSTSATNATSTTKPKLTNEVALVLATDPLSEFGEQAFYLIDVSSSSIPSFLDSNTLPQPIVGGHLSTGGPTSKGGLGSIYSNSLEVSLCGRRASWIDTDGRIMMMTIPQRSKILYKSMKREKDENDDDDDDEEAEEEDSTNSDKDEEVTKLIHVNVKQINNLGQPVVGVSGGTELSFSPGGRYLAITHTARNQFQIISIADLGEPNSNNGTATVTDNDTNDIIDIPIIQATPDRFNSFSPLWGRTAYDIKLAELTKLVSAATGGASATSSSSSILSPATTLYFLTDRDVLLTDISSPWGTRAPTPYYPDRASVYALPLVAPDDDDDDSDDDDENEKEDDDGDEDEDDIFEDVDDDDFLYYGSDEEGEDDFFDVADKRAASSASNPFGKNGNPFGTYGGGGAAELQEVDSSSSTTASTAAEDVVTAASSSSALTDAILPLLALASTDPNITSAITQDPNITAAITNTTDTATLSSSATTLTTTTTTTTPYVTDIEIDFGRSFRAAAATATTSGSSSSTTSSSSSSSTTRYTKYDEDMWSGHGLDFARRAYRIVGIPTGNYLSIVTQLLDNPSLVLIETNTNAETLHDKYKIQMAIIDDYPSDTIEMMAYDAPAAAVLQGYGRSTSNEHWYLVMTSIGKVIPNTAAGLVSLKADTTYDKNIVDSSNLPLSIMPTLEYEQMFADAWRMLRDYFYDKNMHGVDWPTIFYRYQSLVKRCSKREELDYILQMMSSELSALHVFVYGGEYSEPLHGDVSLGTVNAIASLGASLRRDVTLGGYVVTDIYERDPDFNFVDDEPMYSPLSHKTLGLSGQRGLMMGDVLVGINGESLLGVPDVGYLLRGQAGHSIRLDILRVNSSTTAAKAKKKKQLLLKQKRKEAAAKKKKRKLSKKKKKTTTKTMTTDDDDVGDDDSIFYEMNTNNKDDDNNDGEERSGEPNKSEDDTKDENEKGDDDEDDEEENELLKPERDVVMVVPITKGAAGNLRYAAWEYATRRRAKKLAAKAGFTVGYAHLRDMSGASAMDAFVRGYFPDYNKDAMIVDVRHNRGGNIDSWLLDVLSRRAWTYWESRATNITNGGEGWDGMFAFRGHLVVLVDEHTSSDGEGFSRGVKELNLGKLIGTRTWGGGIWLSSDNKLVDGGIASAPEIGVYNNHYSWGMGYENHGVDPDLLVDNNPRLSYDGRRDTQLEVAIRYLQQWLKEEPIVLPKRPGPHPNKSIPHDMEGCPATYD